MRPLSGQHRPGRDLGVVGGGDAARQCDGPAYPRDRPRRLGCGGAFCRVLSADVSPEAFVAAIEQQQPRVLCMSALLRVTMPAVRVTIEALKNCGVRAQIKVLVGGAPVTQQWAHEIGADGYSESASGAVAVVRSLLAGAAA